MSGLYSGLQYFLTDHLGSVVAVTDANGTLISEQRYLPFGQERTNTITQTDLGYTGQRDLGMGLMDYNARFYSPYLNRFIQPDTIIPNPTNSQSWNRFSYVRNNPINFNDPSGHIDCTDGYDPDCGDTDEQGEIIAKPTTSVHHGRGGGEPIINPYDNGDDISSLDDDIISSILNGIPSEQEVCKYFFSYLCAYDPSLLFDPSIPNSIPSLIDYSVNGMLSFWDAYTINAIGLSGNVSGGAGLLSASGGIDGLYLFDEPGIASYLHAGPSPAIGGSASPSVAAIIGLNIDNQSSYEGGSQSVEFRLAAGSGIRVGYFWPAFHAPFRPNDPQGFIIGPAGGAAASLSYSTHMYGEFWHYDP